MLIHIYKYPVASYKENWLAIKYLSEKIFKNVNEKESYDVMETITFVVQCIY